MSMSTLARISVAVLLVLQLCGCSTLSWMVDGSGGGARRSHADGTSSLVEFLYPKGEAPPEHNAIPELSLPLRVGLAFLPARGGGSGLGPDAAQREQLLRAIAGKFSGRRFIRSVVTIPDYYLGRGAASLDALQRLYQVDVVALVSYDQVGYETDRQSALTYLTIIGAFVVNGTHNEATTLVDLAVIDPKTRSLLLRAGGTDMQARNSTWIDSPGEQLAQARAGYTAATDRLIDNFDVALKQFELDVQQQRAPVRVSWTGGGGALDVTWLAVLLVAALARSARRQYNGALLFGTPRYANSRRSTHL
jgi:rhombotail lipoprotein